MVSIQRLGKLTSPQMRACNEQSRNLTFREFEIQLEALEAHLNAPADDRIEKDAMTKERLEECSCACNELLLQGTLSSMLYLFRINLCKTLYLTLRKDYEGALALAHRNLSMRQVAPELTAEWIAEGLKLRGDIFRLLGNYESAVCDARDAAKLQPSVDLGSLQPLVKQADRHAGRCDLCGQFIHLESMKKHRKQSCPQRIYQCECGDRMPWSMYLEHRASECDAEKMPCEMCQRSVRRGDLETHRANHCPLREVPCANFACKWTGPQSAFEKHTSVCPFESVTCQCCLDQMHQFEMLSHSCSTIDLPKECLLCSSLFAKLLHEKKCPPTIFLSSGRRSCSHGQLICIACAHRCKGSAGEGICPLCRTSFNAITAFPVDLINGVHQVPEKQKKEQSIQQVPGPRVPNAEECYPGAVHWMSPLDIRFTHDSIKDGFRPFRLSNGQPQLEKSILDTTKELLCGQQPEELDELEVVLERSSKLIFLAGTGNRRLCMWRMLSLFHPDRWRQIRVRFVDQKDVRDFDKKMTTLCRGRWIEVRWGRFVGGKKQPDRCWRRSRKAGDLDPGVQWPDATAVLSGAHPGTTGG